MEHGLLELLALLLTIALSAAAAGASTYYLNRSKELAGFLGAKAEALYSELEILDRILGGYFAQTYSIIEGATRAPEAGGDTLERAGAHFATIKMLIGFYLPSLSSGLARAIAAAATAHRVLRAAEKAEPPERPGLLERLDSTVCEFKDALEALKADVLREGRVIAGRNVKAPSRRRARASTGRVLKAPA
jgi:hypothetical protein